MEQGQRVAVVGNGGHWVIGSVERVIVVADEFCERVDVAGDDGRFYLGCDMDCVRLIVQEVAV